MTMGDSVTSGTNCYSETQWKFNDGIRTIDYVMVWVDSSHKPQKNPSLEEAKIQQREIFENHLVEEGLELEEEFVEDSRLHFVKIHTPLRLLKRYAEILELRCPIKQVFRTPRLREISWNIVPSTAKFIPFKRIFEIKSSVFSDFSEELTETYTRSRDFLFDVDSPGFFTPSQKARIVQFILERTLYNEYDPENPDDVFEFGINRLLINGVYVAAYPLHDGEPDIDGTMRNRFYNHWASFKNFYKMQPNDQIMQYFGVKIAFFFVWIGHYTKLLIVATLFSLICFFCSLVLMPYSRTVNEICEGNIKEPMCPLCDHCDFWKVSDHCAEARFFTIFDNEITVVIAIFMSFWAAIYLESWKRHSAEITFRWDLSTFDNLDENPRAEYAAKLSKIAADKTSKKQINFITNVVEPRLSFWKHLFLGKLLSFMTMLFLILLAVIAAASIVIFEMVRVTSWTQGIIADFFLSMLNLICIMIFSPIYNRLSVFMTELEMHRTQPDYDNALMLKMYVLQFINYYTYIFYIAFYKGKFVGPPSKYHRIFGFRQLECTGGSCMLELTEQLVVVMLGKRMLISLKKLIVPFVIYQYKKLRYLLTVSKATHRKTVFKVRSQWEKDFVLAEERSPLVFIDSLDMVIQYGFVTIFASAFPLAPLFALINNVFEIRIDAQKLLLYRRRSPMKRCKDIGIWFNILNFVSCLAVFTNGYIIAFTSSFIPKLVFRLNKGYRSQGFLNYTLSYMAIEDLDTRRTFNTTEKYCRYEDFRQPPWSDHKYEHTETYWIILSARFGFFILFENMIIVVVILIKWLIPDVSQTVMWKTRRRRYLIKEMIISYESSQKIHRVSSLFLSQNSRLIPDFFKTNFRTVSRFAKNNFFVTKLEDILEDSQAGGCSRSEVQCLQCGETCVGNHLNKYRANIWDRKYFGERKSLAKIIQEFKIHIESLAV